jgi:hypothetical protein
MKHITKDQIKAIQTAIRAKGLLDEKESLVQQYTTGRTGSVGAMYFNEAHQLLQLLNGPTRQAATSNPGQKMINSIIAMAREMGMITKQQVINEAGLLEFKSDYTRFNEWLITKSTGKKKLNDYTYEELPKLVTQFKNIYISWLKKHH